MAIRTGWLGLSSNSASPVSLLTAWNQARSDLRSKAQSSIVGVTDKRELKSVTKLTEVSSEALSAAAGLTANAVEALPDGRLAVQLDQNRPLRIKLGIDPTAPDIHLGHTVVLLSLIHISEPTRPY